MENRRKRIIMVDDDRTNLTAAKNALIDTYDIFTVSSGARLFSLLEKYVPDLILLDIEMPEMNGYEVIKLLKSSPATADIPVMFLSALSDAKSEVEGFEHGAVDYIYKPFTRSLLLKHIELHLHLEANKKNLEEMVDEKTKTVFELQNTILKTVASLVERRDDKTGGHIARTQTYLRMLVEFLLDHGVYYDELSSWDTDLFVMSSQLHDVGKISIRDDILLKPGKLTDEEFENMMNHASAGADIIRQIEDTTTDNAFLNHAELLAESHHERWDGSGYPFGLKEREIPLQGRLMAIVDVYDALTNERPYKEAYNHNEAIEIIREGAGTHFDPLVAEIFLKHEKEFERAGAV